MEEILASLLCDVGPMTAEEIQVTVARLAQQALAALVARGAVREVMGDDGVVYDVDA